MCWRIHDFLEIFVLNIDIAKLASSEGIFKTYGKISCRELYKCPKMLLVKGFHAIDQRTEVNDRKLELLIQAHKECLYEN